MATRLSRPYRTRVQFTTANVTVLALFWKPMVPSIEQIYFYAKIVSSVGAAIGVIYGSLRYLHSAYQQRKKLNDTVILLATNHLPHIQQSLEEHGKVMVELKSDMNTVSVRLSGVSDRLEDTAKGVHTLNEALLRHLDAGGG